MVLLAAHRARTLANGLHITVDPENDKSAVIALREIAEKTIVPSNVREGLVHSMQHNAEVDEPEPTAVPTLPYVRFSALVRDGRSSDTIADVLTEDKLLKGFAELTPMVPSTSGRDSDADPHGVSPTTAVFKGDR